MKKILFFSIMAITLIPMIYAVESDFTSDSGVVEWRFCDEVKSLKYSVFNGTLLDTVHLKLQGTPDCESGIKTQYQFQIFHSSNNQTDFTLEMPGDEIVDVRVVGKEYLENFQFNDTNRSLTFSDFTHDKIGQIAIILDLKENEK